MQGIGYWYRSGRRASRQRGTQPGGTSPHQPGVVTRAMASSIHSRGDSASSLVESGGAEQPGLRPLVFMHGVGFGIVSRPRHHHLAMTAADSKRICIAGDWSRLIILLHRIVLCMFQSQDCQLTPL